MIRQPPARIADGPARHSLLTKGLVVLGLPMTAMIVGALAQFSFGLQKVRIEERLMQNLAAQGRIEAWAGLLAQAENEATAYVLTGDRKWLERFQQTRDSQARLQAGLVSHLPDTLVPSERFNSVRAVVERRIQLLAARVATPVAQGPGQRPTPAELLAETEAAGEDARREFRSVLAAMEQIAAEQKAARHRFLLARLRANGLGLLFSLTGACAGALVFTQWVVRRVKHLDDNARRLAVGAPLVLPSPSQDEIGRLERTLGRAADLLAERERGLEASRQQLEDEVRERTAVCAALEAETRQRREAEEQLQKEHAFQSLVLNTIGALVVVLDRQGSIVRFNRACERATGYSPEETLGRKVWDFLLMPEDTEPLKAVFHEARSGRQALQYENTWVAKGGERRLISWSNAAVVGAHGEVEYVIGAGIDITVHRRAEEDIRKLSRAVEQSPVSVLITDLQGNIEYVNPKFTEITGYSAAEVLGQNPRILKSGETPPEEYRRLWRTIPTEEWRGEFRNRRKNGELLWEAATICPVRDARGTVTHYLAVKEDITERKRMEEALEATEERFRVAAENASDVIGEWDLRTGGMAVFGRLERLCGGAVAPEPDPIPQSFEDFQQMVHPDDHPRIREAVERHLATGETLQTECRLVHSSGAVHYWSARGTAVWDAAGNPYKWIVVMRDISERMRAEAEIHRLNAELEQRVRDRTAQLEAANKELEAFCYSVSHDLRAPLRSVDGFSRALLEDYAGLVDGAGRDYLERVRAAALRMGQLIDGLLNLSRLTRNEMCLETVDLSALAREIAAELRSADPERRVEFVIAEDLVARGDARLLRVVLDNLLGNAWKFTAKRPRATIEFAAETPPDRATVYFVRDDGAGFDMTYSAKLFGPFQRLHATTEFAGTGIGLATVQRIVTRHGGQVWAEGAVDRGATLRFTLSAEQASAPSSKTSGECHEPEMDLVGGR